MTRCRPALPLRPPGEYDVVITHCYNGDAGSYCRISSGPRAVAGGDPPVPSVAIPVGITRPVAPPAMALGVQ